MPYATQNDLLQRVTLVQLTQLTDDANAGQPNAVVVGNALEEASGMVEAAVRNRYATPLQASDIITAIVRDIAVYELYGRRPQQMPDTVLRRYEDAMAKLDKIGTGKWAIDLPAANTPQTTVDGAAIPTAQQGQQQSGICFPSQCGPGSSATDGAPLRFTDSNLAGFR
jgi:phage gp36-like protein